jgi:hypothetical protein
MRIIIFVLVLLTPENLFDDVRMQVPARKTKGRNKTGTEDCQRSTSVGDRKNFKAVLLSVQLCTTMHTYKLGLLLLRPHGWPIKSKHIMDLPRVGLQTGGKKSLDSLLFLLFNSCCFQFLSGRGKSKEEDQGEDLEKVPGAEWTGYHR